jgi:hypothetical protein
MRVESGMTGLDINFLAPSAESMRDGACLMDMGSSTPYGQTTIVHPTSKTLYIRQNRYAYYALLTN